MNERTVFRGQLAELKHARGEITTEANGLIVLIRMSLNPYESDFMSLDIDSAAMAMSRLVCARDKMAQLRPQIEKLERELNG